MLRQILTLAGLRNELAGRLTDAGLADARTDALDLVTGLLPGGLQQFLLNATKPADPDLVTRCRAAAARRAAREPLAYILGEVWFCGLRLAVGPGVFVPRSDSEILVRQAIKAGSTGGRQIHVLDLCAGSGCIGLAVATELNQRGYEVWLDLTETDPAAAYWCRRNIANHVWNRSACLCTGDLFPDSPTHKGPYDLIITNPPYIAGSIIPSLEPEVALWEPRVALDGGVDGLDLIRRIVRRAQQWLVPGGWLLLEHGYDQVEAITELLLDSRYADLILGVRDYGGNPRVSGGRRPRFGTAG